MVRKDTSCICHCVNNWTVAILCINESKKYSIINNDLSGMCAILSMMRLWVKVTINSLICEHYRSLMRKYITSKQCMQETFHSVSTVAVSCLVCCQEEPGGDCVTFTENGWPLFYYRDDGETCLNGLWCEEVIPSTLVILKIH